MKNFTKTILIAALALFCLSNVANGQSLFKDLVTGTNQGSQPKDFITVNGTMYFITVINGSSNFWHRLWKSDGTPAGTVIVKDSIINTNVLNVIKMIDVNGTLFFAVNMNGSSTSATTTVLWKTDGTTIGTVVIDTLNNANPLSSTGDYPPQNWTAVGNKLFFQMGSGNGMELWVSDGTAAGTMEVIDLAPGSSGAYKFGGVANKPMVAYNGNLYFSGSTTGYSGSGQLYVSDGTLGGTTLVNSVTEPYGWKVYNNELYFNSDNSGMWKTDGTTTTSIFSGEFGSATIFKNMLYFKNGIDLWKSDGTTVGTVFVMDSANVINGATSDYLFTQYMKSLAVAPYYEMLYKRTDGNSGTIVSNNLGASASFKVLNNKMYQASADGSGYTSSLWVTDGTEGGTSNIFANQYLGSPYIYNGTIFFSNFSSNEGYELWSYTPSATGISTIQNSQTGFIVYPNPVQNELSLVFEDNTLKQLEIINVLGEVVIKTSTNNLTCKVNTEKLSAGVHFIRFIDSNNHVKTTKFIKN